MIAFLLIYSDHLEVFLCGLHGLPLRSILRTEEILTLKEDIMEWNLAFFLFHQIQVLCLKP